MKTIENKTFDEERALYGARDILVKDCAFDGPADGEYLDEDMDFTFEDWSMPEEFAILEGMM